VAELHERDAMVCRHCGKEERASEGYPCAGCGTFLCIICTFRGYAYCLACEKTMGASAPGAGPAAPGPPAEQAPRP
jgi:hypothetical protein